MSVADEVVASIEAIASWHRIKAREGAGDDHLRGVEAMFRLAAFVRTLPDNDTRLVELEAMHLEHPSQEYLAGPGVTTMLRRVGIEQECEDLDEILTVVVDLEHEDLALD